VKSVSLRILWLFVLSFPWLARADAAQTPFPAGQIDQGSAILERLLSDRPVEHKAKNVILFIGDGMGVATVTAARILEGQSRGASGEENFLSFERFPYSSLIKIYSLDEQIPDSAGTMSAIMTGQKLRSGTLSIAEESVSGVGAQTVPRALPLPTLLEQAEDAGLSTGIVTTTRVTHATPAACFAHSRDRDWEADADMPAQARAQGEVDIARQLLDFAHGDGIDVVLGGGRSKFLPHSILAPITGSVGERLDQRDLTKAWLEQPKARYVTTQSELMATDPQKTDHLLGLFASSHLAFATDRTQIAPEEPSLAQMTSKAIELLRTNERGFLLVVESGRIDHAHHMNNAYRALDETIELAKAVEVALQQTNPSQTLIVVTADHSHGLTFAGKAPRGNPVLGKAARLEKPGRELEIVRDVLGNPYAVLSYANGPGAAHKDGRTRLDKVDTLDPDFHQQALVALRSDTHSGEDVPLYALGPNAQLFHGVLEQHAIFYIIHYALFEVP